MKNKAVRVDAASAGLHNETCKDATLKGRKSSRETLLSSIPRAYAQLGACMLFGTAVGAMTLATPHSAQALGLYTGEFADQNLTINLETTVQYSNIYRVNDPSALLTGPANQNGSEGDINFRHGFVDNTFDVLPVFDLKYGNYGAHVSGEAFADTVYLQKNQNNQPNTFNPDSTTDNRDFTSATRNVNGLNAVLLDAFVYGTQYFGAEQQQALTVKFGRQTLLWGQSLLFTGNGIAAGQAPVDIIKAQTLPNAQTQQIFLPVGQAVVTYQPNQTLTFQGYYQFEWQPDTFQGVGAYFNSADILDKGGQRLIFAAPEPGVGFPGVFAYRGKDLRPGHNGQFGLSVQATLGNYDLGLYGLRFDSKAPELYLGLPEAGQPAGSAGTYRLVYPRDIGIFGAALSTTVGPANVGGEISGRVNQPLDSGIGVDINPLTGQSLNANASSRPLYAVGDTLHGQVSALYISPGLPGDPGGVTVTAEAIIQHLLHVSKNQDALAPRRNQTAAAFHVILSPTYYEVLPGLELQFPIGFAYNALGRSQIDGTINHGTGSVNVGITATYKVSWIASIFYNDYIGAPTSLGQTAIGESINGDADRGYLAFNLQHTF